MDIPQFIYSSVDGHWVVSTLSAIMNNADISILHKFLGEHMFSFLLGICLGVELLGHMVIVFLTFEGTAQLFSTAIAPFYIPTSDVQGFLFLHILSVLVIFHCFDYSHCSGCEVVFHCGFDLHFLSD